MALSTAGTQQDHSKQFIWAGYLLGFSLGGFFDGILLHQVLQWHHLLTNVQGEFFQDIEVQILADGLFHVLMYFVAFAGLWLLWKSRREYALPLSDRKLLGNVFIGFGTWHILDGILSHWILGIHRIRMDSENVLFWDLLWFFVFGVAFVVIGWMIRRTGQDKGGGSGYRKPSTAAALILAIAIAGPVAALPPKDVSTVMVFFKPGTTTQDIFAAINSTDARILWASRSGNVWALDVKDKSSLFYKHGAYLVSSSAPAIGCLAWTVAQR